MGTMMRFLAASVACVPLLVASSVIAEERPGYSYLELTGDFSTTANEARGAQKDADGRLIGIAVSWQFQERWYTAGRYSVEKKTFQNEAAGTVLTLQTRQPVGAAAIGRIWHAGEGSSFFFEAMVAHTTVDHDVPDVRTPVQGPPIVGTRVAVLEDTGFGAGAGWRLAFDGRMELESRIELLDITDQTETKLAVTIRREIVDTLAVGLYTSYSTSTDRNFDDIAKFGVSLRFRF